MPGAEAWRTALEAWRAELEEATPSLRRWPQPGARLTPGPAAPHPGLQPQTAAAVLTVKGPDQRLLGAPGKGVLVVVAPAAKPRLQERQTWPRELWDHGQAVCLTPHPAPGGWLQAGQQDILQQLCSSLLRS